jgi:hypothetical protein
MSTVVAGLRPALPRIVPRSIDDTVQPLKLKCGRRLLIMQPSRRWMVLMTLRKSKVIADRCAVPPSQHPRLRNDGRRAWRRLVHQRHHLRIRHRSRGRASISIFSEDIPCSALQALPRTQIAAPVGRALVGTAARVASVTIK